MYQLVYCRECFNNDKLHKLICIFGNYYRHYDKLNKTQVNTGFKIFNLLDLYIKNKVISKEEIVKRVNIYNIYNESNDYGELISLLDDMDKMIDTKKIKLKNIIDIVSIIIGSEPDYVQQLYKSYIVSIKNFNKYMADEMP